jgi:hypothetical protein
MPWLFPHNWNALLVLRIISTPPSPNTTLISAHETDRCSTDTHHVTNHHLFNPILLPVNANILILGQNHIVNTLRIATPSFLIFSFWVKFVVQSLFLESFLFDSLFLCSRANTAWRGADVAVLAESACGVPI